jgi:hypothetical protein
MIYVRDLKGQFQQLYCLEHPLYVPSNRDDSPLSCIGCEKLRAVTMHCWGGRPVGREKENLGDAEGNPPGRACPSSVPPVPREGA